MTTVGGIQTHVFAGREFIGMPQVGDLVLDSDGREFVVMQAVWQPTVIRTPSPRTMWERRVVLEEKL